MTARSLTGWLVVALVVTHPGSARSQEAPTPDEERAAFRMADPKLSIELVAAEPIVQSPVAIAWDERGRMYVAEMRDYPAAESGGAVKRLEDRDGDGLYDHATTFADGLRFPNGVLPWNGGVLVTAAPDIWYFKDTDDDGVADEKRVILTGFAEGNQQLRVNGLTWGLDNWIYGANGRSGGAIREPTDPPEKAVPIPRNDFRFRPDTGEVQAIAGFSQFGLPHDDWGNRFPSWNTVPIRQVVLEERTMARNPFLTDTATVAEILDPADRGRVYSLAPPPVTFNGEPIAFFNASCGPTIYRGDALPEEYRGDAFVCEPLTSLVHRRKLVPNGPTFVAKRVEQGKEFLASTHPWFRPVNLSTGPDGALYVVDFCRSMVEHPAFVPKGKGEGVDFRRGHEHGRIWRVKPAGGDRPARPRLDRERPDDRLAALVSPNGWARDTAQRLLIERGDGSVAESLERLAREASWPVGRVQALATLSGLAALDAEALRAALDSPMPRVREQALRLMEQGGNGALGSQVAGLADDPDAGVRFRAAIVLGQLEGPDVTRSLVQIAGRDADDPWTRLAVLSGLGKRILPFLDALIANGEFWFDRPTRGQTTFLEEFGAMIGAAGAYGTARDRLTAIESRWAPGTGTLALFAGLSQHGRGLPLEFFAVDASAESTARDAKQPADRRVLGAKITATRPGKLLLALVPELSRPATPTEVRSEIIRAIAASDNAAAASAALNDWPRLPVTTRRELLSALTRTAKLANLLLVAVELDETIAPAEIDPATRESLRRLPDPALREGVERVFGDAVPAADRAEVIRRYETSLNLGGDPQRGAAVFERNCLTCHQRDGKGHRVGPDLASVAGRAKEMLLSDLLDPNREVAPDSTSFVVVTRNGQVLSGLIAAETAGAVILRRSEGIEEIVPRADIAELRSTGQSLMPVGLESALSPQDVADLIELLRRPTP